jgi:hypothetical protein
LEAIMLVHFTRDGLVGTLLGCLSYLAISSVAQAVPFQQYLNGNCTGINTCNISFTTVQVNRRMVIDNVSCYLRLTESSTNEVYAMQLLARQGDIIHTAVTLVPSVTGGVPGTSDIIYAANHAISAFANAGQRFQAYVEKRGGGAFSQFACHISGDLVAVP